MNNLNTSEITFKTNDLELKFQLSFDENNVVSLKGISELNTDPNADYGLSGMLAIEFINYLELAFSSNEQEVKEG